MKFFFGALFAALFLTLTSPVFAAEMAEPGTPVRKLQRGFLNIALSPFELSHQFAIEKKTEKFPPSWLEAIGRGSCYMVGRAVVGVGEVVTFFVPAPANYGPILQPEFPWELSPELPQQKTAKA